jgi:hypothetical protein
VDSSFIESFPETKLMCTSYVWWGGESYNQQKLFQKFQHLNSSAERLRMYSRIMCNVLAVSRYLKSTPARLMPGLALFANRLGCRNVSNKVPAQTCITEALNGLFETGDFLGFTSSRRRSGSREICNPLEISDHDFMKWRPDCPVRCQSDASTLEACHLQQQTLLSNLN